MCLRDVGDSERRREQRRADLPRDLRRLARGNASRRCCFRGRRSGLVGRTHRAGRAVCDQHRGVLRRLQQRAGRLPRHDRARSYCPADRPTLRRRVPADHGRRHGRGADPAGGPPGGEDVAGRGGGVARRTPGADLGDPTPRPRADLCRHRDLTAAHVAGAGLRRHRPQRDPDRPALPRRAVLRPTHPARHRPRHRPHARPHHLPLVRGDGRQVRPRPPRPPQAIHRV